MQINEDKQLAEYDKLQTRKCLLEFKEKWTMAAPANTERIWERLKLKCRRKKARPNS